MTGGEDASGARDLDVDHLADLANLPVDDGERAELAAACREVLEAFELEDIDEAEDQQPAVETFADEPDPWPEDEIEAILDEFPDRDGRSLRA